MDEQRVYGLDNETNIINYLNHKTFSSLNEKWQNHIRKIFPNIKEDDLIKAKHFPDGSAKPDMILEVGEEEIYISIKSGSNPAFHNEAFFSFQRFLKRLGVDGRTLEIMRFYHYGDSRKLHTNGTPLTFEQLKERFMPYFKEASKNLDKSNIIKGVIRRAVIQGTSSAKAQIDFLYYGDLEHGNILAKEEIYDIVMSYRHYDGSPIHFGCLTYTPNSRKVGRKERNYARIRWPMLAVLYYRDAETIEQMKNGTF